MQVALHGPQGEERTKRLASRYEPIPVNQIHLDPEFSNCRLSFDGEEFEQLVESMKHEGLKSPITVIEAPGDEALYLLRAGFRRVAAARKLGWETIPACIMPEDTPEVDEHWVNIVENSSREDLSTYELAHAAHTMRTNHGIDAKTFALRTGYAESHIRKLLRCLENLPDEILEAWKQKRRLPLDELARWSALPQDEALARFNDFCGKRAQPPAFLSQPRKRSRSNRLCMASAEGLRRMTRVWTAIRDHADLNPDLRPLLLQAIEFCMGARRDVPGIYDPRSRKGTRKSKGKAINVYAPPPPANDNLDAAQAPDDAGADGPRDNEDDVPFKPSGRP